MLITTSVCMCLREWQCKKKLTAHAALARPYSVFLILQTWLMIKFHTKLSGFKRGAQMERQRGYLDVNVTFFFFFNITKAIHVMFWCYIGGRLKKQKKNKPSMYKYCMNVGGKLERKFILVVISSESLVIKCNFMSSIVFYLLLFH